jgi:hypothetical protein
MAVDDERIHRAQRYAAILVPVITGITAMYYWSAGRTEAWASLSVALMSLYLGRFLWRRSTDRPARFGIYRVDESSEIDDKRDVDRMSLVWAAVAILALALTPLI